MNVRVLAVVGLLFSSFANAEPVVNGNIVTFPEESRWWQVEIPWSEGGGIICNKADTDICELEPGTYKWILDGEEGRLTISENTVSQPMLVSTLCALDPYDLPILGFSGPSCSVSCPSGMVIGIESYASFDSFSPGGGSSGQVYPDTINTGLGTSSAVATLVAFPDRYADLDVVLLPNRIDISAVCL